MDWLDSAGACPAAVQPAEVDSPGLAALEQEVEPAAERVAEESAVQERSVRQGQAHWGSRAEALPAAEWRLVRQLRLNLGLPYRHGLHRKLASHEMEHAAFGE